MNSKKSIRILIADDQDIYLEGLESVLTGNDDIKITGKAYDGEQLVHLAKALLPDVVLTDIKMPHMDGIQAIKEITALGLPIYCIVLSTYLSDYLIVEALEAGAMGYISKNVQRGEVEEAIKTVCRHQPYYCSTTTLKLARQIAGSSFNPYKKQSLHLFTGVEKEIIRLICEQKTSEEISKELFISKRTVEGMRAKILEKTGMKTPIGLVIYAIQNAIYFVKS